MARKRLYKDAPMVSFVVRVQEKYEHGVKRVASRLGVSEIEAKRAIVDAGINALMAA